MFRREDINSDTLREKYSNLIKMFESTGIQLNESQREVLDNFMVSFKEKLNETRRQAIEETKRIVEHRLGNEYKKVVESILSHSRQHSKLASNIESKLQQISESKRMVSAVDGFLDLYLEEVLPKKQIVDYKKMKKQERILESLKGLLEIKGQTIDELDDEVEDEVASAEQPVEQITEIDEVEEVELEEPSDRGDALKTRLSELEEELCESRKNELLLTRKLHESKAKNFIMRKTKDLPVFEADEVKKKLQGMHYYEMKTKFKQILKETREELSDKTSELTNEISLDDAITNILEGETSKKQKSNKSSKKSDDKTNNVNKHEMTRDEFYGMELENSEPDFVDNAEEVEDVYVDDMIEDDRSEFTEALDAVEYDSDQKEDDYSEGIISESMMKYWIAHC